MYFYILFLIYSHDLMERKSSDLHDLTDADSLIGKLSHIVINSPIIDVLFCILFM